MARSDSQIEFESDGVRDSLTGTLAPARFLEILRVELQIADREGRPLTIISIKPSSLESSSEELAVRLREFAEEMCQVKRAGDHCSRISENGFWYLVRGDLSAAKKISSRLLERMDGDRWKIAYCQAEKGDEMKHLLRKIDQIHFAK